jgi:hypothetical protein
VLWKGCSFAGILQMMLPWYRLWGTYEERRLENVLAARALTSPGNGLVGVWREVREL